MNIRIIINSITVFISICAFLVSIHTCYRQNKSNTLVANSNSIAIGANDLATKAMYSSTKFDIITAQTQWAMLKESYKKVDLDIFDWEANNEYKRDGKFVESVQELNTLLNDLNVPLNIRRLYEERHEKYITLKNVAEQYEPFKKRLANINFTLPAPPILPTIGNLHGGSTSGGGSN